MHISFFTFYTTETRRSIYNCMYYFVNNRAVLIFLFLHVVGAYLTNVSHWILEAYQILSNPICKGYFKSSKPHQNCTLVVHLLSCMVIIWTGTQIEFWISFSNSIKNGSVLPQQKCSAMTLRLRLSLELFELASYNNLYFLWYLWL